MKNSPILITGCARSGTSLTAGIIQRCGAWGGQVAGGNTFNEKGMYENTNIRNHLVKPYLKRIGADPLGQNPLPKMEKVEQDLETTANYFKDFVFNVLRSHGYVEGSQWYYKGAKLCLIWPIWAKAFPEAKWVIVRREDYDICSSCLKTTFMRAFSRRRGWQFWVDEHKKRFEEMKNAGLNVVEYWPFKSIAGNIEHTRGMIESLGLTFNEKEVRDFITPDLWHHSEEGGV